MATAELQALLAKHSVKHQNATFDYVIVGGGTAGLCIAHRLVTETSARVAVIEAGGFEALDNENKASIPGMPVSGVGKDPNLATLNAKIDWMQRTTPQHALTSEAMYWAQGKVLGGNSTRNYMGYHRASRGTYDKWAEDVGDDSYSFDRLLPFFKKSCRFTKPDMSRRPAHAPALFDADAFDADGGPLEISTCDRFIAPMTVPVLEALRGSGIPDSQGAQNGNLIGNTRVALTLAPDSQTRSSSETAFLRDALKRSDRLSLFTYTMSKRIHFSTDKRATGVEVLSDGESSTYALSASKEVILSAGAIRSPQLLMVSGIGPQNILSDLSIPLIHNSPGVGSNMQDHTIFGITYEVSEWTHSTFADPAVLTAALEEYTSSQSGPIVSNCELLSFEKLPSQYLANLDQATRDSLAAYPSDWPNIEYIYVDAYLGEQRDLLLGAPPDGKNYATLCCVNLAPHSRGTVRIASADTAVHPLVDPAWHADARDRDFDVQVLRRARDIVAHPALQAKVVGEEKYPGAHVQSDEQIAEALRSATFSVYHPAATCKMGREEDGMAVLDSRCRVRGVHGLRVVDASALPFLPPGHPQATVYCLAEKIAMEVIAGFQ